MDTTPDTDDFARDAELFRRELVAYCYRMVGSAHDAEDLVQETYLRAWRSYAGFQGRSSLRSWLYRIATNVCLTEFAKRGRRMLPSGLGGPAEDPQIPPELAGSEVSWLEPIPDAQLYSESADPAVIVASLEGLRLALVASLQYLPARQRAVLILREVLRFPAVEVAEMLDTTTAAVKSSLQRARARLQQVAPVAEEITEPSHPQLRELLNQYIAAFENADAVALKRLLCQDVVLEATPLRTWLAGCETCLPYLTRYVLGSPGDWRMVPTKANGQPAAVAYLRDDHGIYQEYGIVVLTITASGISRISSFGDPTLVATFGASTLLEDRAEY